MAARPAADPDPALRALAVLWPLFLAGRGTWRHVYIVRHSNAADLLRDGWRWSEQPRHE
ncbi:hypothetical protein ACFP2T_41505 [Plantactinospora solaniradicis]|uniref:Transposase n=1 Tax=Plantactinospora solaniradicis TaxID=1723736 RepID=A0ABW1KP69_9ACTN